MGVRVCLLGGFRVVVDGNLVDDRWRLRKAKTLVKLLALADGHRLHRDVVVDQLWPDVDPSAATNNLHQVLHAARRAVGADAISLDGEIASLRVGDALRVDVDEFERLAAAARADGSVASLSAAVDAYGGELLPEDAGADWADPHRERLAELHAALVTRLAAALVTDGRADDAVAAVQPVAARRPVDEPMQLALIEALAASGRRWDAVTAYERLRDTLDVELATTPSAETKAVYRRLLGAGSTPTGGRPNNLPAPSTSFVGRERALSELAGLLDRARLVTLTGPGGSGKSRLGLELARRLLVGGEYADGVWLAELAGLTDGDLVPSTLAAAVALALPTDRPPAAALAEQIGDRQLLLLLDNCEHLLDACVGVVELLLARCPRLVVVTTSREPLSSPGEVVFRVPSLELPPRSDEVHALTLGRLEAIQLFVERAAEVSPGFHLDAANARDIVLVCQRLDGMPLALELAAARLAHLSVGQLAERLDHALAVLSHGGRGRLDRQQTLAATLDWSHDLLAPAEQVVFRRLSVFAGGFETDAAEAVCADVDEPVVDVLARLIDKSLVQADTDRPVARYRLLEVVRQYAAAQLARIGETEACRRRHRDWYARQARAHDPELVGMSVAQARWFDDEHDNLRASLASLLHADPSKALEMAVALWRFWIARGLFNEGRRWLQQALDAVPEESVLHSRALFGLAVFQVRQGSWGEELRPLLRRMADVAHRYGDEQEQVQAMHVEALLDITIGEWFECERLTEVARERAREIGSPMLEACVANVQALLANNRSDSELAEHYADECLAILETVDDSAPPYFSPATPGNQLIDGDIPWAPFQETVLLGRRVRASSGRGYAAFAKAWALRDQGRFDAALLAYERSMALFVAAHDDEGLATAIQGRASLLAVMGSTAEAQDALEHALSLRIALNDVRGQGMTRANFAFMHALSGRFDEARSHLRAAVDLLARVGDVPGAAALNIAGALIEMVAGDLAECDRRLKAVYTSLPDPGGYCGLTWLRLTWTRVVLRLGRPEEARQHWEIAREMIERLGSVRPRIMLDELAKELQSSPA